MTLRLQQLGAIYGLTGERIRQLRERGAPVEDPDALHDWLEHNQVKISTLALLLMDAVTRGDLRRKIESLTHPR